MAQIKPFFQDGTYIKTNDLNTLATYIETLGIILGNIIQPGVLGGLTITGATYAQSQADPALTVTVSAGYAILESGKLMQFDATDLSMLASTYYQSIIDGGGYPPATTLYIVKTDELAVVQRPNLVGQIQTVQSKDVFSVVAVLYNETPPTTLEKVRLATMAVSPYPYATPNALPSTWVQGYNYALNSLTHSGAIAATTAKYAGPQLNGAEALIEESVTGDVIAPQTIQSSHIITSVETDAIKEVNISRNFSLCPVGVILPVGFAWRLGIAPQASGYIYSATQWAAQHPGWYVCNGGALRADYHPELYNLFLHSIDGATLPFNGYNSGGIQYFYLPDLRGTFIRGLDNPYTAAANYAKGLDPDSPIGNPTTQRRIGTTQAQAYLAHSHLLNAAPKNNGDFTAETSEYPAADSAANRRWINSASIQASGGAETRPVNVALNYIIFAGKPANVFQV